MYSSLAIVGVVIGGVLCVGLALMVGLRLLVDARHGARPRWSLLTVGLTLVIVLAASEAARRFSKAEARGRAQAVVDDVVADVAQALSHRRAALRVAAFALGRSPAASTGGPELHALLDALRSESGDGATALAVVDVNGAVHAVSPRSDPRKAERAPPPGESSDETPFSSPALRAALRAALARDEVTFSPLLRATGGRRVAALVAPLEDGGSGRGLAALVSVLDTARPSLVHDEPGHAAGLFAKDELGRLVELRAAQGEDGDETVEATVSVGGLSVAARRAPGGGRGLHALDLLPVFVLEVGILIAVLLGGLVSDLERRARSLHRLVADQDRQLRATRESVSSIVEAAPDGLLVVEAAELTILRANDSMATMLATEAAALAGVPLDEILMRPEIRSAERVVQTAVEPASPSDRFVVFRDAEGRPLEAEVKGAAIVYEGRPATLLVVRDVSDVEKARRVAEAATQAKTEFLSSISHEIRTPLNAILGLSNMTLEETLPQSAQDSLATIEGCAQDLLVIVDNLLDLSRLESGAVSLRPTVFDPRAIVSKTLRHLAPRARSKGLVLTDVVRHDVPATLLGDARRIEKMLLTLVGNAIKFTESGDVGVVVRPAGALDQGVLPITIEVCDTGPGIPGELHEAIFEPFKSGPEETSASGAGLGLAIVAQSVAAMKGTVSVESEDDEGATFTITIPFRVPSDPPAPAAPANDALVGRVALVVHPSPLVRSSLRETLLRLGLRMLGAAEWRPAREAARRVASEGAPVELILASDEQLATAGDLLDSVREYARRDAPLVALSVRPRSEPLEAADDVILLPCGASLVERTIEKALFSEGSPAPVERIAGRILVVEDSAVNRRLLEATLRRAGHAVEGAENGLEAIERLWREDYDLVLMDVQMPVLDGLAATRRLRRDSRTEHLPVVALTALARSEDRDLCLAAGMDDYLAKPVQRDELISMVSRWLGESRLGAGVASVEATNSDDLAEVVVVEATSDDEGAGP